ncbi:MAG: VOC family protein [Sphingobacteriaceae bacterium]|nr:MAG: VOC family protein [Sphingobacteriaceae bacterium]
MTFKNAVSWFEIPALDINRAQKFYEAIFDIEMIPLDMDDVKMRMFPLEDMMTGIGGALCQLDGFYKPSADAGPIVYMNGNPNLQTVLDKVEAAGGKVVSPKTEISPEYGYMGMFIDTEGNRIALHSMPDSML